MFHRHMFSHGPWRERWFQKGDLKYVILDLVKDKPRHGYEIIRSLQERSHGFYSPSPGSVYPTLQLLEEMEYVKSDQQDGKKVYSITEEGLKFLEKREEHAEEIKSQMEDWWPHVDMREMGETMREFGNLARLVAKQASRADSAKMEKIRKAIADAYREIEKIISE
ncbi:MAG: PadR family transcriptional regulator [Chloroflexi bacterium]|nr:PadR family transcriptional regulator [Chloroflexota bacterium]